jgi:hypothetical protein
MHKQQNGESTARPWLGNCFAKGSVLRQFVAFQQPRTIVIRTKAYPDEAQYFPLYNTTQMAGDMPKATLTK